MNEWKRQTKTSIYLIMLSFIINIYVKEYFIATFSIQPIVTTFLKNAKVNVLELNTKLHAYSMTRYTHIQVRYDILYSFTIFVYVLFVLFRLIWTNSYI